MSNKPEFHPILSVRLGAALVTVGAVAALGACKTTAEITFIHRLFNRVGSSGTVGAQCDAMTPDAEAVLSFYLVDTNDHPIELGQEMDGDTVGIGPDEMLNEQMLRFYNSVLYPSPDIGCASDDACAAAGYPTFTCGRLNPVLEDSPLVCQRPDIEVIPIQDSLAFYPAEGEVDERAIVVAVANGESIQGWFDPEARRMCTQCSTDPRKSRVSGVGAFITRIHKSGYGETTEVCPVIFDGQSTASVMFKPSREDCLMPLETEADVDDVENITQDFPLLENRNGGQRGNWVTIIEASRYLAEERGADDTERHVLLFTDGADTGSMPELNQTFENALQTALDSRVIVSVIQLDNPYDVPNDGVEGQPRIGPNDQLAQIACATGGTFQYAENPDDLEEAFSSLGYSIGAHWEVTLQVADLLSAELPRGTYRLATEMSVTVGNSTKTVSLRGDVPESDSLMSGRRDNRLTLFKRPIPDSEGSGG